MASIKRLLSPLVKLHSNAKQDNPRNPLKSTVVRRFTNLNNRSHRDQFRQRSMSLYQSRYCFGASWNNNTGSRYWGRARLSLFLPFKSALAFAMYFACAFGFAFAVCSWSRLFGSACWQDVLMPAIKYMWFRAQWRQKAWPHRHEGITQYMMPW